VSEENLSIVSLILNASLLVQLVMAILLIASVISWVMIVQRGIYLRNAQSDYKNFEDTFWSGVDLNNL
jgi:biopolymer transport protein TolQ